MTPDLYSIANLIQITLLVIGVATLVVARRSLVAFELQARATAEQVALASSPRLYVEGVRAVNFYPGKEPVFFLRIANAGPVQAENVRVFIEIKYQHGGVSGPTGEGNAILIPANGHRDYDFRSSFILPENMLELHGWNLTISGTVTHERKPISYCYKYNRWEHGVRPEGVPLFVPCDFDDRRVISATARLDIGGLTLGGSATVVAKRASGNPDPLKPNPN